MTFRQKLVAKKLMENNGVVSRAMIDAGYSVETAKNPQQVTNSKGWKELMEKYLPDDKLLAKHDEALNAVKVVTSPTEPDKVFPDYPTQVKALDLAYKVKGRYTDVTVNQQFNGPMEIEFIEGGKGKDPPNENSLT